MSRTVLACLVVALGLSLLIAGRWRAHFTPVRPIEPAGFGSRGHLPAPLDFKPDVTVPQTLVHEGRFDELLEMTSQFSSEDDQVRWLLVCIANHPGDTAAAQALALRDPAKRQRVLDAAMQAWVLVDPVGFAEWIPRHLGDQTETDRALALLIEHTDTLHRPTATALAMAKLIHSPHLRQQALDSAIRECSEQDLETAIHFVQTDRDLTPDQRLRLMNTLMASGDF